MEQEILDFYKEQGILINPSEAKWDNSGIMLDNNNCGPSVQPYLPVTVLSETKTGRTKKTKVNICLSYCPICGKSWREKDGKDE